MGCHHSSELHWLFRGVGFLNSLNLKWAKILALTRPSRYADLVALDLQYHRHTPERVVFQEASLAKQSRQGKPRAEFFFLATLNSAHNRPAGIWIEDRVLLHGSNEEQTRLFLAVVRPHKPVCLSTLARWLKSLLVKSGIDTSIFKVHSTWSAAKCRYHHMWHPERCRLEQWNSVH